MTDVHQDKKIKLENGTSNGHGNDAPKLSVYCDYGAATRAAGLKRGFLDTDEGQIHFCNNFDRVSAQEAKETLLFLHQTPMSTNEYIESMISFSNKGYRVIAFDYPGYGDSDKPKTLSTIKSFAKTAIDVLNHCKAAEKVVLIGNHSGACVAIEICMSFPNRVKSNILICVPNFDAEGLQILGAKWKTWSLPGESDKERHTRDMPPENGAHLLDVWKRRMEWVKDSSINQRMIRDELRAADCVWHAPFALSQYPICDYIPQIHVPTLLLWGSEDSRILDRLGYKVSQRKHLVKQWITKAPCEEVDIEKGSPMLVTELPDVFVSECVKFLNKYS